MTCQGFVVIQCHYRSLSVDRTLNIFAVKEIYSCGKICILILKYPISVKEREKKRSTKAYAV